MKTKAVRLYGAMDLRLEEFELPEIKEDEVLLRVVTDSLCASTYKAVKQGSAHKRVPPDISTNPVIVGHEMCGEIVEVGNAIKDQWKVGQKIVIQPALKLESGYDPGYSYTMIGGSSLYAVVPKIVMERGCMIPFEGDSYFKGSMCTPRIQGTLSHRLFQQCSNRRREKGRQNCHFGRRRSHGYCRS